MRSLRGFPFLSKRIWFGETLLYIPFYARFFVFTLRLCERVLEECGSPGVDVLVLSLVVWIREISTSSSPTVEPDRR